MKKLFVAVLAIAAAVACNTAEVVDLPQGPAIQFENAFVQNATRVGTTSTDALEAFDVWAYIEEKGGIVLVDEDVTKGNGQWGYANLQYWAPGHNYYFTALAPMNSANWDYNQAADVVTFTNVDGTEDLLYAYKMVNTDGLELGGSMEAVKLNFAHLLSKVNFTFTNGFATDNVSVAIKGVTMTAVKNAEVKIVEGTATWSNNVAADLTLAFGDVANLASGADASVADERLTIPTAADYVYTIKFYVDVYFGTVKAIDNHEFTSTITGVEFAQGKAYNLSATIDSEKLGMPVIEFDVNEVAEWVNGGTHTPALDYVQQGNTIFVKSANGLQSVVLAINNGAINSDVNIVLNGDIDLAELQTSRAIASNWTPLGTEDIPFEGIFNGNGYAIKNFNYVADESVYFVGLIGCAQNATVKNLTVENATVEFASETEGVGGTIGVVVGGLYGTSTLENITVKGDVKVAGELDKKGAGRIGAVVGGNEGTNNVVVKNVRVEANAGSYVQGNNAIGGISGQLQGTATFTNCYSNINVIAGQYFAGGIEGLSAAASTFTNCQSAGNVSVVAGRAGNANDLYRVGAITGGWADGKGKTLVLTNCSYTGTISGQDAAGAVAETLDCAGYVGRGYAAAAGSNVSVNGVVYAYKGNGVYESAGAEVKNADELKAALADASKTTIVLAANGEFGTIVAKSNKTIIALDGAKVNAVVLNGSDKVTLKNIAFDAANAVIGYDGAGKAITRANIVNDNNAGSNTPNRGASNIVIDGCVFTGAFANGGASIGFTDQKRSGGFTGNVTVKNCTFETTGAYYNIYGYYCGNGQNGYGDFVIENNTFNSTFVTGGPIYLGRYASSTPVVVKGNAFKTVSSLENAVGIQAHSGSYTVSVDASDNTFAL